MRKQLFAALLLGVTLAAQAASGSADTAAKPAVAKSAEKSAKPAKERTFGLTQSLAVLFACPEAHFDNANIIALGGVISENKARIDASPVSMRMDLMTQLVAEETAKAQDFVARNKLDCAADAQPAAAYWNRLIQKVAKEAEAEEAAHAAGKDGIQRAESTPATASAPISERTPRDKVKDLMLP